MENLLFSNIVMREVNRPFFFTLNRFPFSAHADPERLECGVLRNIQCSGIRAMSRRPALESLFEMPCNAIVGIPGHRVENVSFTNVRITMPGGGTETDAMRTEVPELDDTSELWPEAKHFGGPLPASVLFLRHVEGLSVRDCRFEVTDADCRPFVFGSDVIEGSISTVSTAGPGAREEELRFSDSSVTISGPEMSR